MYVCIVLYISIIYFATHTTRTATNKQTKSPKPLFYFELQS